MFAKKLKQECFIGFKTTRHSRVVLDLEKRVSIEFLLCFCERWKLAYEKITAC